MQHRLWHLLLCILTLLFFAPCVFCAITGLTALPTSVTYSAFSGSTTTRTDTAPLILAAGTGSANVTISTSGGAWLTAQLSSGTITGGGHVSITIKVNPTGLNPTTLPTTYKGTVTVASGAFTANIAVNFVIYQGTDATFTNLPAFPLNVTMGTSQTHTVTLTVVNNPNPTQGANFHYSATPANGTGWLTAAINSASALNFTTNAGTLPAGAYAGTVEVDDSLDGTPFSQYFNVSMIVPAPTPAITTISPSSAAAGGAAFTLTVNGSGFQSSSSIQWNGSAVATTFKNASQLTASIPANLIATAGAFSVTVLTSGAPVSNAVTFTVNPVTPLTITNLSPSSATAGGSSITLSVTGTGFVGSSTVEWNGQALTTGYQSSTQLLASITTNLIAVAGSASVTVVNSGGATSNAVTFTINSVATPAITNISPSSATAGGSAFQLTVNGSAFQSNSTVQWNGSAVATAFVSASQLTASIPANLIATAGSASVTVLTSGAPVSNAVTFTVNAAAALTITSLSPSSATAGASPLTLSVTGTGFVNGSTVQWNGSALSTSYQSSTQLLASVTSSLVAVAGSASVTVVNPGGATSNAVTFTINSPAPTITNLSSSSATAGGAAFSLTVSGSGFVSGSVVQWNGSAVFTSYGSATQLTASITANLIASPGITSVTVLNPGSATSNAVTFTVNSPAPTITNLSPSSAAAVGAAFSLTVNGSGFVGGSVVQWNGSGILTSYGSAAQLTASITANLIASPGNASVTVVNPGGAASNAVTFAVSAGPATPNVQTISHIADGQGWRSTIILVNTDTVIASYQIKFVQDTGGAGSGTGSMPWSPTLAVGAANGTIQVGASVTIQTADADPKNLTEGWAQIVSSQSIGGTAIFRYDSDGQEAAVPLLTSGGARLEIPYQVGNSFALGAALANPSATQTANVTEVIRDQTGAQLSTRPITIAPMSHFATNPPALTPLTGSGVVEYDSNVSILGLGIRLNVPAFTSIDAVIPQTASTKTISHIADGQGWRSTIILVNTDTVIASYQINFVQDTGGAGSGTGSVPWSPTLAVGLASGTIPVGGSVTIQTADADPKNLTEGWAQIVSSQSIGGTAIFRYDTGGQEAAVPLLTTAGTRLEIPYQVGNGLALGVAIANPSATQTANVTETIRDQNGNQLSTRLITIAPMSHFATNPPTLTPLTGSGGVEYDSNVNIYALGIRLNGSAFTSVRAVYK